MKTHLLSLILLVLTLSSSAQTRIATGASDPSGLTVEGDYIYTVNLTNGSLVRANKTQVGTNNFETVVSNMARTGTQGNLLSIYDGVYTPGIAHGTITYTDVSAGVVFPVYNSPYIVNMTYEISNIFYYIGLYYIANSANGSAELFEHYTSTGGSGNLIATLPVDYQYISDVTTDGSVMYFSTTTGSIYQIDLAATTPAATLVTSGLGVVKGIHFADDYLYYLSSNQIRKVHKSTLVVTTVSSVPGNGVAMEIDGYDIYAANSNGNIYKINDPDFAPCTVNIPDANFKAVLVADTAINTNGDTEIQCSEASAFTGQVYVYNQSVSDLTGIEAFVNLTNLYCGTNLLTSLDVSNNLALEELYCLNNNITSLDVSANTSLTNLNCHGNNLTSLNVANGNNTSFPNNNAFQARNNPNLTCVTVDDVTYSTTNWTNIDAQTSFSTNCNPCTVNIPDANFKSYLVNNTAINTNGDTEIQCSEASAFTGFINIENQNVSDVTGIEAFINMTSFRCDNNNTLTSLDLSANTAITYIHCNNNNLTSINISGLTNLEYLYCYNNSLTNIDVSGFTALSFLICHDNNLTSLNVSGATALETIQCYNNNLTNLDVSTNTNLLDLACNNNNLTSLNVSGVTILEQLYCSGNSITSLDVSANTNLYDIRVNNNALTYLNVANGINSFISASQFNATNNPNLTCVTVDDVTYSTTNWTNIDAQTSFSTNCNPCTVNIPDANFKSYLVNNTAINTNGDTEIQCSEASAFTGQIYVQNANIADLTGIELFTAITELYCYNNQLTSLDVSQNTALVKLVCYSNNLTSIDVSANTALENFQPSYNSITSLDVSANTALTLLYCNNTSLTSLDVSQNTALVTLSFHTTSLTSVDVSSNTALETLFCYGTNLTSLDVSSNVNLQTLRAADNNQLTSLNIANGNNGNITTFEATNNPNLTCIQVDDAAYSTTNWTNIDTQTSFSTNCNPCTVNIPDANFKAYLVGNTAINTNGDTEIQCSEASAFSGAINVNGFNISDLTGIEAFTNITDLFCYNNNLTSIDVSQNTALIQLNCANANLTSLDVSANIALQNLQAGLNNYTSLDVSANTALLALGCETTGVTSLDVSQNTALVNLNIHTTSLTSVDLSSNTALEVLYAFGNNNLTSLNIANGNNAAITYFDARNNPNLTCVTVDDVAYSTTNWTNIDAQTSFSTNCSLDTIYVNHAATGNNDGTTWANAYMHLETALASATNGDEIWVAAGTYLPNTNAEINTPFNVTNSNLKIYGGFAGTETQLSDRVLGTNETILSGDFNSNDVFVNDHFVNNLNHPSKTDNSKNIIYITASANNVLLDGLTISNAHNSFDNIKGGAIFKEETVEKLTIKNCTIKNNIAKEAAPGIFARFELNNTSSGTRGELIVENSKFINNMSRFGSGIYAYSIVNTALDIHIENCLFDNNMAGNVSNTVRGLSGSASWFRSIDGSDLDLKLINNTYVNQIDDSDGSGITSDSRAVVAINTSNTGVANAEVVNCIFWNNYKQNSTSTTLVRSITNTYMDAVQSVVVKNSIDQLNFNDGSITSTVNTSNANPLFTNINNDVTLQSGSPAIDTGDNSYVATTTDLAGNLRIYNTTVDMGVYEFGSSILSTDTFNLTKNEIKLYPNPTTSVLNIKMKNNLKQVTIYSILGKEVLKTTNTSIDVSSLSNGLFLIKIEDENGSISTKRFIKQ